MFTSTISKLSVSLNGSIVSIIFRLGLKLCPQRLWFRKTNLATKRGLVVIVVVDP